MATVVLQSVGAAIGSAIAGPFGAIIGRAAGAAAGYALDQAVLSKDQVIEGPRLDHTRFLASSAGAPIPKIYGRNKVSGQIIWATRFEEQTSSEETGGKGSGPKSTVNSFRYYANFAVGICEGPASGLRRVWADGKELDLTQIDYRFYTGDDAQMPDPLIEAKQGARNAPAYRGTCYIVFDGLLLENYGNRIPQLSFEVIRAIGKLEDRIKSVTVIPGSTEYGYDPLLVATGGESEPYNARNRHTSIAQTDWQASIDELQALCPNLEQVALVVTWFGTDLRAGECQILPGVTGRFAISWNVAGYKRHEAHLISKVDGKPAFGGTPDDSSIIRAIVDLKKRGLRVVLYPFIMMDIPPENSLPDPFGEESQSPYPWRGEITCFPAPGVSGTVDKTNAAATQIAEFSTVYSNLVNHYVSLAKQADGVDGFLVGSELRGLTRVRDGEGNFPFVETLESLASFAKQELGPVCLITYGADWTEYFGYQPRDGSGDVFYNLDSLWASPAIDAIGIDNYMPISDARNGRDPENTDIYSGHDVSYLKANIAAGEGYDWYYASPAERLNGVRTPIKDGSGEPWIYRYKDLVSWWSNAHHERPGGVRSNTSSEWLPRSKPVFFTELGCPAVDHGPNQPNVFYDPKSAQSALPYFSHGARDDLAQRRFLEAHYEHWTDNAKNPQSDVYPGRMVDVAQIAPWAWDARPYPWFPLNQDIWSDGHNWNRGHWLNGRLGGCSLQELVTSILKDHGHQDASVILNGHVEGFIVPAPTSARTVLEPLVALFDILVSEHDGNIRFRQGEYADRIELSAEDIVQESENASKSNQRISNLELPAEAILTHASVFDDYDEIGTVSRRLNGGSDRQITMSVPAVMPEPTARHLADRKLRTRWKGRETCDFELSRRRLSVASGDLVKLPNSGSHYWLVENIDIGVKHSVRVRSILDDQVVVADSGIQLKLPSVSGVFGKPDHKLMDLPALRDEDQSRSVYYSAISANPWAGEYAVYSAPGENGFELRSTIAVRAKIGILTKPLAAGPRSRFDIQNTLCVRLNSGAYSSAEELEVLNGANALAVEVSGGGYEVLQFLHAKIQPDQTWILSSLLRGQLGTDTEILAGAPAGASVILLDRSIQPIALEDSERGVTLNWRVGPARFTSNDPSYLQTIETYRSRSRQMFSPVHLTNRRSGPDSAMRLGWVRRGRIDADSWENADIPLDASVERYVLRITDLNNALVRTVEVQKPEYLYQDTERIADLGTLVAPFTIEVAQIGDTGIAGSPARLEIHPIL